MFGSQLHNQATSWNDIVATLTTMESGRWVSAWFFDHFLPPWSATAEVLAHDKIDTLEGWALLNQSASQGQALDKAD